MNIIGFNRVELIVAEDQIVRLHLHADEADGAGTLTAVGGLGGHIGPGD
ncbi:MAG: hypothetical protein JWO37_3748 [Acidimicrobiales bacterium]|jgi:hypothetical protein|nr:hypothetical protein [Acidimicrobiales bacterium]